ncbi:hypothetical protein [Acetobacter fallax]|nr:hypothetical protein [Acetobacter fallax]
MKFQAAPIRPFLCGEELVAGAGFFRIRLIISGHRKKNAPEIKMLPEKHNTGIHRGQSGMVLVTIIQDPKAHEMGTVQKRSQSLVLLVSSISLSREILPPFGIRRI